MAITQNTYTGDGTTVLFSFTFPYLETTDIKVTLDGSITTAYTLANATTIQFNTAPTNGVAIRIYRETDDEALSATFYPGSAIRAQDLNDNFTQNLYVTQEVNNNSVNIDGSNPMVGNLNMNGFQITNLPVPAVDTNAATKKYVDDRTGNVTIPGHTYWRYVAAGGETTLGGTGTGTGILQYSSTREQVFINGALQQRNVDYTADDGLTIELLSGTLIAGDVVDVRCVNNLASGNTGLADDITYSSQFTGQVSRSVASRLSDVVSVKDFGAVGDGVTDDTAAINAAAAAHNSLLFPAGTYKLSSPLNLRGKSVYADDAVFTPTHSGITLILGGNSAAGYNPVQRVGTVGGGDVAGNVPSVRIIGAKHQHIWIGVATYVQVYADIDDKSIGFNAESSAYSSFWIRFCSRLELETKASPTTSGQQWINENTFYLNRIQSLRVAGTYQHNHNRFLYGSFENGTIDFVVGYDNRVEGLRGETSCDVTFASGTSSNVVLASWTSSGGYYRYPGTVTDNGSFNHVGHERWKDTTAETLTAFSYRTLQKFHDDSYNVFGVRNLSVNTSSISCQPNIQFYDTDIIPCDRTSCTVIARITGLTNGGYRSIVDGYDADKNPITPAAGDINVVGSGNHPFGAWSFANATGCTDELALYVYNPATKYIRVRYVAGPLGLTAEGFAVAARYNNDPVAALEAQAITGANVSRTPNRMDKVLPLSDNVQATLFTLGIPALSQSTHNVSFGFEISYVIRLSRDSSTRVWSAVYGKIQGVVARGWESNTSSEPIVTLNTTDQNLVQASGSYTPVITWQATKDAGADSAAKNIYLNVTVDSTVPAVNNTAISATITWNVGGGNGGLTNVTVS